jgi:hypothetical protein
VVASSPVTDRDRLSERAEVIKATTEIADAIALRDVDAVAARLAPEFVHRIPGGATTDAATFLSGIRQIPGEISFVRLEHLEVDIWDASALVSGIQHAQVRIDGYTVDDRRAFVDWFVKSSGGWRLRAAVEPPPSPEP